ncbi:MAG: stage III sporulation protein AG [Sellimonas sp.]|uniref:stage III sporulation protein AG n=1 Tax=Sellimonas sp. TaxID=2021466 RepID=UPI0039A1FD5C
MNGKMTWITKFLKNPKIPAKNRWLILFLFGLLILVIAMPVSDPKSTKTESGESRSTERTTQDAYAATVERKLTSMLSDIEGAGKVKVMITLSSSSEKVVEKDVETGKEEGRTTTREETVYSDDSGQGQVPYVTKELSPDIEGVVVIAEGGEKPVVVQNITEAVQALFGVESHKIKVVKMKQ